MFLKRWLNLSTHGLLSPYAMQACLQACICSMQDKRRQMMNDVRALCDAPHVSGLIDFVGAYHELDTGQASLAGIWCHMNAVLV